MGWWRVWSEVRVGGTGCGGVGEGEGCGVWGVLQYGLEGPQVLEEDGRLALDEDPVKSRVNEETGISQRNGWFLLFVKSNADATWQTSMSKMHHKLEGMKTAVEAISLVPTIESFL